ncbi:MAG: hypothetical protein OXU42_14375, partial [Deltaproteobacteria bacterium]|nr:hypothetical protein [Deltaproteobacteria bacterium]
QHNLRVFFAVGGVALPRVICADFWVAVWSSWATVSARLLVGLSTTYPYTCPCHHDQSVFPHRVRMSFEQFAHGGYLFRNRHVNEAYDARMWQATHKDQLTKVLVFGNEHPLLIIRQREHRFIRGAGVSFQA